MPVWVCEGEGVPDLVGVDEPVVDDVGGGGDTVGVMLTAFGTQSVLAT